MFKLYGTRHTGTCAAHAALEEAQLPYELIEITTSKGEHLTDAYRKINPRQQVPALELPDGTVVTEGPAILGHIADSSPSGQLAPASGSSQRAQMNRWILFFSTNVYEGELRKLFPQRYTNQSDGSDGVQSAAVEYVNRHYEIFEAEIESKPYFFGEQMTVLDIYVWMLSQWMDGSWLESNCPNIAALADNVRQRPRITPVHQLNFG